MDPAQRARERKVAEIFRNFILAVRTFRQQEEKYRQGSLCFSDLAKLVDDRGQSILFALKESCHSLFRRGDGPVSEKEQIFDLTVGTLFHLGMKIREDLYQLEVYGPSFTELGDKRDGPSGRKSLVHQFKERISRARNSFREGMEEMAVLFQEVLPSLRDLLEEHRESGLLLRFLLEERGLLQEVLGQDALEDLFQAIYGPRKAEPYRLAGKSYLRSGFYSQAAQVFSLALEKSPADHNLLFLHHLSRGMVQFYSFAPQPALKSLEKCLSLPAEKEELENFRDMIHMVCQKIQEEFPGRRKSDPHREAVKKARALKRQLEKLSPPTPSQRAPSSKR